MNTSEPRTGRRSMVGRLLAMASACALAVTLLAPQDALAATYQPDLFSGNPSHGHPAGEGVWNGDGSGQMYLATVRAGRTAHLAFWIRNEGDAADDFSATGCSGGGGFRVKYEAGGDVTGAVKGGTYTTGTLDVGWSSVIFTNIHAARRLHPGNQKLCGMTASSVANPAAIDVAYLIVEVR